MKSTKSPLLSIALLAGLAICSQAVTVVPIIAYGHNNTDNFGGNITDIYNGSGMNGYDWTSGQANNYVAAPGDWPNAEGDPSTWTQTSGQYRDEWQADHLLDNTTSINNKMGWVILDLGSSYSLENMYLWNGVQIGTSAMEDFNLYYSNGSPTIPATQGPTGSDSADDYDFGVAAWTKVNGGTPLTLQDGGSNSGVYSMSGITARYVAIEMMSRHSGAAGTAGRIGFGEVAFTAIPEPSVALLSGLGALMLLRRRKH